MIKFPKELEINKIEDTLLEIHSTNGDLIIPIGARSSYFGGLASAIQCINTWVRKNPQNNLEFKESVKSFEEQIDSITCQPYKFSGALMAKSISLSSKSNSRDIKQSIYTKAKFQIENQAKEKFGVHKGNLCFFSFVDHSTKGFDRNFYSTKNTSNPFPRKDSQIKTVIRSMVEKSYFAAGRASPLTNGEHEIIGRIFTELFKNTHEHGSRCRHRNDWIKPAVRTIFTKSLNLDELGSKNMTSGYAVMESYVNSLNNTASQRRRFLELGIVDSGLGFYKRWLSDHQEEACSEEKEITHEYNVFKKCFSFRSTSSSEHHKGMGLPVVMERLTELKGLMKVRSGRLSLYRDFSNTPYTLGDDCEFYDWFTESPASVNQTVMANVEGVSITLLLPLGDKL